MSDNDTSPKLTRRQARRQQQRQRLEERLAERPDAVAVETNPEVAEVRATYDENFEKIRGSDSTADHIIIDRFSLGFPGKRLFQDASLTLNPGHRYALVGKNGVGKTTLLRAIANRTGEFNQIPRHFDILYVEQEVAATQDTVLNSVLAADQLRIELLQEEQRYLDGTIEFDPARFELITDRLEAIEAYSAEARASSILRGLGFSESELHRPVAEFSGGWRMRIALARALSCRPTCLLLDEPTNHLDLYAVIWLTTFLQRWRSILVVVSHDGYFMNDVCTDIIACDRQKLVYYRGQNWDSYRHQAQLQLDIDRKQYKRDLQQQRHQQRQQQQQRRSRPQCRCRGRCRGHRDDSIDNRNSTKQPERPPRDYTVCFNFLDPTPIGIPVIQVKDVSFSYESDRMLFRHLEFGIDLDSRIALIGPNGAGKTTLLNLIKGKLTPNSGEVVINRKLVIGEFTQHFVEHLDPDATPITSLRKALESRVSEAELTDNRLWQHLARFGLTGKTPNQRISTLSGGQKSRVVFSELAMTAPHILFLDEPTNHLDVESIEGLVNGLQDYSGGLVLVSHDVRLITDLCDQLWVIRGDATVEVIRDCDFADYRQQLVDEYTEQLEREQQEREQIALARAKAREGTLSAKAFCNARPKGAAFPIAPQAP